MTPAFVRLADATGIERLSREGLLTIIGQLTAERDELRRELTMTIEGARALRAVVLSMAARAPVPDPDLLALADALTGVLSTTQSGDILPGRPIPPDARKGKG
jgi:hypothetical protein